MRRSRIVAYGLAMLFVAAAFALRWALDPLLQEHAPLMLFILAAVLAASCGGWSPGLTAAGAGLVLGDYFFIAPYRTLGPHAGVEWAYLVTFSAEAGVAVGVVEAWRRARRRAERCYGLAQSRGEQLRNTIAEVSETEAKLRELAAAVESARDAIVVTTLKGKVRSWNAGTQNLLGYTAAEMLGQSVRSLIPPERQPEYEALLQRLCRGEGVGMFDTVLLAKDGRKLEISLSLSPVRDASGNITSFSAIARDLTELKRAAADLQARNEQLAASRQALELERSRYRELFDSAPVAYIITSREGTIQEVNHAAAAMLEELPDFLVSFPLARLLAREDRPAFFANVGRLTARETDVIQNWEASLCPRGRGPIAVSLNANLVLDAAGQLSGLRWLVRDISERKRAEEKILRLNAMLEQRVRERTQALEAANRELEAFSYSVSHDLKAPLRSINGFSKALLEEYGHKLDEQGLKYLNYAHQAALRMNRLVDDLIELSRASRGELHQQQIDLSHLAATVVAELQRREPAREIQIRIAPGLLTRGDEGLLRIAMENLLGNAWKFTSGKSQPAIEVGATDTDGANWFFVRDNGAGFNMANADRLFGVFQRLHSQNEFPGTGIGLATVRRIFNRHGGEVRAEAKINEGATFYFRLPNGNGAAVAATPLLAAG